MGTTDALLLDLARPLVAYLPFVDPLPAAHDWWWLTAPVLCLGIAMVHKAYRMPSLEGYAKAVGIMAFQVLVAMILFAAALFVLVLLIVPRLPMPT